jgi:hypothetical protein
MTSQNDLRKRPPRTAPQNDLPSRPLGAFFRSAVSGSNSNAAPEISSNAASEINNNGAASEISSNAPSEISSSNHLREAGGFRLALGPGHGHVLNAVSEISRKAVSDMWHVREGGFRLALGPGHGHFLNAVSEISRQAVSDIGGKAACSLCLDMGIYEVRSPRSAEKNNKKAAAAAGETLAALNAQRRCNFVLFCFASHQRGSWR